MLNRSQRIGGSGVFYGTPVKLFLLHQYSQVSFFLPGAPNSLRIVIADRGEVTVESYGASVYCFKMDWFVPDPCPIQVLPVIR